MLLKSLPSSSSTTSTLLPWAFPRITAARTTTMASVDRYNLIRTFFRQQYVISNYTNAQARTVVVPRCALQAAASTSAIARRTVHINAGLHSQRLTVLSNQLKSTYQPFHSTRWRAFSTPTHEHSSNPPNPHTPPPPATQRPCTCQDQPTSSHPSPTSPEPPPSTQNAHPHHNLEDYPRLYKRLAQSLPHPHRPTRDDFLKVATNFWQRMRIRFKWFAVRGFRRFNADDISAFVTWFLMSQTLWILVGTTTFFSVIFATANSLQLQHYIARAISDYLTSETGVTIIFESAIVPKWKDSKLSFKNVYVSRRPNATKFAPKRVEHISGVGYDVSNHPSNHHIEGGEEDEFFGEEDAAVEDWNMSFFDLTIDSVDVTLSLWRWLDGKGLVEDAVVKGVRGVLDRRSVFWDPENPPDPAAFRHQHQTGDFELESLQLEDVLVTVYQPDNFRPYTASIFRADIRCFRKQWLFYDFLRAENVVGQFDNCLFSLHKPQSIGRTTEKDLKDGDWARMTRIRIDGVNIDHLQGSTTTTEGPLSWITSGKVDAVLDIKFPRDPQEDLPFNAILGEIADAISTSLNGGTGERRDPALERIPGQRELARPPLTAPEDHAHASSSDNAGAIGGPESSDQEKKSEPKIVIDIDLRFRDLKAAVPIFTQDLSYVNNALIRPIVAFMNANRTLVPIHCRVVKDLSDFDGSWTMWDSGLMDEISLKVYDALAYHVTHSNMNRQRIKTVSLWSLQMTASAVLSALRTAMDPVSKHLKEVYMNRHRGAVATAPLAGSGVDGIGHGLGGIGYLYEAAYEV